VVSKIVGIVQAQQSKQNGANVIMQLQQDIVRSLIVQPVSKTCGFLVAGTYRKSMISFVAHEKKSHGIIESVIKY